MPEPARGVKSVSLSLSIYFCMTLLIRPAVEEDRCRLYCCEHTTDPSLKARHIFLRGLTRTFKEMGNTHKLSCTHMGCTHTHTHTRTHALTHTCVYRRAERACECVRLIILRRDRKNTCFVINLESTKIF